MKKLSAAILVAAITIYVNLKWIRPWVGYQAEERRISQQCADMRREMNMYSDEQLQFLITHAVYRI